MEIATVHPGILAFVRPLEGANVGLIQTAEGAIAIDTTSCAADMQRLLDQAGVAPSAVHLVINTHSHSDHTWGNQLFQCPILAHRRCKEIMVANLDGPWDISAIETAIAERKSEPQWASEMRAKIVGLRVTLPTETFEGRRALEIGGVALEVIHVDAHTPGSAMVWLPEPKVLFAGDIIFAGRYPFIGDADIPALIDVLRRLPDLGARAIVPGHGRVCGEPEIAALANYLETTWERTKAHVERGHSADEAANDPGYPRYAEQAAERLHAGNIRVMYGQLATQGSS